MENKMRRFKVVLVFWIVLSVPCRVQAQRAMNADVDYKPSIQWIEAGNEDAILAAGNSGDTSYIHVLRSVSKRKSQLAEGPGRDAQMALAKLGDKEALFEIACEFRHGEGDYRADALLNKVSYVGGWFAIENLSTLLNNRPENANMFVSHIAPPQPARFMAIDSLINIIHRGPTVELGAVKRPVDYSPEFKKFSGWTDDQVVEAWANWITSHKAELEVKQPSASFSPFPDAKCEKYYRKARAKLGRPLP